MPSEQICEPLIRFEAIVVQDEFLSSIHGYGALPHSLWASSQLYLPLIQQALVVFGLFQIRL